VGGYEGIECSKRGKEKEGGGGERFRVERVNEKGGVGGGGGGWENLGKNEGEGICGHFKRGRFGLFIINNYKMARNKKRHRGIGNLSC